MQKIKGKGQSVKQTVATDGQMELTALPSMIMQDVTRSLHQAASAATTRYDSNWPVTDIYGAMCICSIR